MSEKLKLNAERYLPLGYTVEELKAMDTGTLQQICDEQNLDVDRISILLDKSEHYPSAPETLEDTPNIERPDIELLKDMDRYLRKRFRSEFDIKSIRAELLKNRIPNITSFETHANSITNHIKQEEAKGSMRDSVVFRSGASGLYTLAFMEFGVNRYDELIAQKLTVYEATQQLISDLHNKYADGQQNHFRQTGFNRALEKFHAAMNFDENRHNLQTLIKKVIDQVATPEEVIEINKILQVVKGSYFRGGKSTLSAGKYDDFVEELASIYENNLPTKHMNPGNVAGAEVFDVNTHAEPPEIKEI